MNLRKTTRPASPAKAQKAPTKHQIKSEATRSALLKAAAEIFARDGYERAQLDEIGKRSGRTRGAVYAQYKTKERLFFALQEQRIDDASKRVPAALAKQPDTPTGRLSAIRNYYADLHDADTAVLDLELKLFAMRNPESSRDWRKQYAQIYANDGPGFAEACGITEAPGRSRIENRLLALTAIKSGLVLAMRFLPDELSPKETKLLLKEIFDGLFPATEISLPPGSHLPSTPRKKK